MTRTYPEEHFDGEELPKGGHDEISNGAYREDTTTVSNGSSVTGGRGALVVRAVRKERWAAGHGRAPVNRGTGASVPTAFDWLRFAHCGPAQAMV